MEVAAVMTGFRAVDAKAFVALAHPQIISPCSFVSGCFHGRKLRGKYHNFYSITIYLEN